MKHAMGRMLIALLLLASLPVQAQQISTLPTASTFNDTDLFPATQGFTTPGTGTTRKVQGSILATWITAKFPTLFDTTFGTVPGSVLVRGASIWAGLAPSTANRVPLWNGTSTAWAQYPIGSLSGVTLTSPASGEVLKYDGANWVNSVAPSIAGGSAGQIQYNNAGALGGFAMGGDCTLSQPNITCTTLNSVAPGAFFSGTDAANLTGTLAVARLPSGTTSSASTVPLNNSTRLNYSALALDIGTVATATSTASPSAKILFGLAAGTYEIPASTTPRVHCGANPGGTMTLVWKKNGSTTLCTMSLSTSCVASSCSISNTSFADGDYLTIESTADATVTGLAFGLPLQKKD